MPIAKGRWQIFLARPLIVSRDLIRGLRANSAISSWALPAIRSFIGGSGTTRCRMRNVRSASISISTIGGAGRWIGEASSLE